MIYIYIFSYIWKCLKIYQLNIIKKIKKEKACERYQNLSRKEKEEKWQYGERYKNCSKDEKNKLVSKEKNIIEWEKTLYHNYKKVF